MRRSSESRRDALCCAILCRSFNVLRKVDARLKILREGVVALWCKTKALEKNKRTANKSRASEKGTADEVVVVLLLLSRELFFFALFRAFVGVVRDVSYNEGRHLGKKVSISS